jgi:hypothetical protein
MAADIEYHLWIEFADADTNGQAARIVQIHRFSSRADGNCPDTPAKKGTLRLLAVGKLLLEAVAHACLGQQMDRT